jgi:hypothetical protein
MSVDPRIYIANDKRLPETLTVADAGKLLTVNAGGTGYENLPPSGSTGTGEIFMWPFDTPPAYGIPCGATYNYDDYPALGALFGAIAGGTFNVPAVTFVKNSAGVNTGNLVLESVGTHGHTADALASHTHGVSVTSAPNHGHSISVNGVGDHTHPSSADATYKIQPVTTGGNSAADQGSSTGGGGAHSHSASASSAGAHTHIASADAAGGHTPNINDHVGVNEPAHTLLNFLIRI